MKKIIHVRGARLLCLLLTLGCWVGILPHSARAAAASPVVEATLADGYYILECPVFYPSGLCQVEGGGKGYRVTLLERTGGDFLLKPMGEGKVKISDAHLDYDGLRRSLRGKGSIFADGHAEGEATSWLKNFLFFSRDHRSGAWTLKPASEKKIKKYKDRQKQLEKQKPKT